MLGSAEARNPRLISREIIFDEFQRTLLCDNTYRQIDGQTDRQTTCHGNTALCVASHCKNTKQKYKLVQTQATIKAVRAVHSERSVSFENVLAADFLFHLTDSFTSASMALFYKSYYYYYFLYPILLLLLFYYYYYFFIPSVVQIPRVKNKV